MSWSIPTLIEADLKSGKAQYRTFQTGMGGQSILPVPSNSYVVLFGYDFSPAGGGFRVGTQLSAAASTRQTPTTIRQFETQQISFYTGNDFYPFIHHVNAETMIAPYTWTDTGGGAQMDNYIYWDSIDNSPIARQIYITSSSDVAITVGLLITANARAANTIPVTNRTPVGLTYGGSPQSMNTRTDFGPNATPNQFVQPSPKDYSDFGFGALPANADFQAFATPDTTNGLLDPSSAINSTGFVSGLAGHYFLNVHYALYTQNTPENVG